MKKIISPLILVFLLCISPLIIINCGGGGEVSSIPSQTQQENQSYNILDLPASDAELSEHMEGEVLIRYKKGSEPSLIAATVNGTVINTFSFKENYYGQIKLIEGTSIVESIKTLMKTDGVIYSQPNYIYRSAAIEPNDADYIQQYAPSSCNAPAGWSVTQGDPNVVIAIIDSGVNGLHEEFSGRMTGGYDFTGEIISGGGILSGNENSDNQGHGTHVAGIAAATGNNGKGIAGVDWNCKIMPVKVLNSSGLTNTYLEGLGIYFAVNPSWKGSSSPPANVINMSLGGATHPTNYFISDFINYALYYNTVVVLSMGNDGNQRAQTPSGWPGTIAVGAIDGKNQPASFTTTGFDMSVTAPGVNIYSTSYDGNDTYTVKSGTSMSAPFVSGVCSLIIASHPELNIRYNTLDYTALVAEKVKSHLENTATDIGSSGWDIETGYGKPDIGKAVTVKNIDNKYGRLNIGIPVSYGNDDINVVLYDSQGNMVSTVWAGDIWTGSPPDNYYWACFPCLKQGSYRAKITYMTSGTVYTYPDPNDPSITIVPGDVQDVILP